MPKAAQMEIPMPLSPSRSHEPGVLAEYMDYLFMQRGLKEITAYNYYMSLRMLARYLKHHREQMECTVDEVIMSEVSVSDMAGITKDEWDGFCFYCQCDLRERAASFAVRISIIHGFYRWLSQDKGTAPVGFIFETKRPTPLAAKQAESNPNIHERTERKLTEACADRMFPSRNICILMLITRYGIGLQEICDLDLEDLMVHSLIVGGGNGAERTIPLDDEMQAAFNEYVAERRTPIDGSNCLFVSRSRNRLNRRSVEKIVRKAAELSGLDINARALQRNAKTKMTEELGPDVAQLRSGIATSGYFSGTYQR